MENDKNTNSNNNNTVATMNDINFNSDKYFQSLLKECSLKQIMDVEAVVVKDIQTLHSDMQTLVYENYNKFISATDTIRKMKTDFNKMETEMKLLTTNMQSITSFSEQITDTLQNTRQKLSKLSEKHAFLQKLQFLSTLPAKLKALIDEGDYQQAVQDYNHAQKVLQQYGNQPSFYGIQEDCLKLVTGMKTTLKENFAISGKSAQALTETGELLLQLNEKPSDLAHDMLECATHRMYEHIVMLQDQTERDMIEFIDLGISGFLNDLTLVITAYNDMFIKSNDPKNETFQLQLNNFITTNMDKYLLLIQNRMEAESVYNDPEIMLHALDRLNRRFLAMKNICGCMDMTKIAIDIIINAAYQLLKIHLNKLKEHVLDNLNSVRLTLVSVKGDNNLSNIMNLNEIITNFYTSIVEKYKGVLQNFQVFFQSKWSFNLKSVQNGSFCAKGIREYLLVGFLKYISSTILTFSDATSSSPPNLLLILSRTCLEMDQKGVQHLIGVTDDLCDLDSKNNQALTHETELCNEMRETAQTLLDSYVRLQGNNISQMLRKSVETREWLNCLEPRSVRAVMKRFVEEMSSIDYVLNGLYESGTQTTASSDSSRKTHLSLTTSKQFRTNWSSYTPSQLESIPSSIHRLFSEKIEIFTPVEFSKISISTGIIKICLKTLLECIRLKTFSKYGLQQIQVDAHFLQVSLWRFVSDENLIHSLLDEILSSAVHRCLEPNLMEPNAVDIICERG